MKILTLIIFLIPQLLFSDDKTIKIGMPACLSGACAKSGGDALLAVEYAVKEINEAGGVLGRKFELIPEDSADAINGAKAITAYRKLRLDPEIKFFIAALWTPGGMALAPIASKEEVLIIAPSIGVSVFHLAGDNLFNTWGPDEKSSREIAKFAYEKNCKKAGVLFSQQPWELAQGNYFIDEFVKIGGEIALKIEILPESTNLRTEILKIVKRKPDCIFMSNYISSAIAAKELKKTNYTKPVYTTILDASILEESQGALDGSIHMDYKGISEELKKKFRKEVGIEADRYSLTSYDTVYLLKHAIEKAGSEDINKVKEAILGIKHQGVMGSVQFDSQGCVIKNPKPFIVKSGKSEELSSLG